MNKKMIKNWINRIKNYPLLEKEFSESKNRIFELERDNIRMGNKLSEINAVLPKKKLVIECVEDDPRKCEVIAENGRWKRIPKNGEILKAYYKNE